MRSSAVAGCTPWRIWRRRGRRVGRRGMDKGVGKVDGEFDLFANEIVRLAAPNHNFHLLEEDGPFRRLGNGVSAPPCHALNFPNIL